MRLSALPLAPSAFQSPAIKNSASEHSMAVCRPAWRCMWRYSRALDGAGGGSARICRCECSAVPHNARKCVPAVGTRLAQVAPAGAPTAWGARRGAADACRLWVRRAARGALPGACGACGGAALARVAPQQVAGSCGAERERVTGYASGRA